ncbi:hypothetical protein [Streptomyces sp. NPDC048521]|uniref:hypothetical protein n=1 Tax=Streptomyces sp. NPDC048521 TaxID=3365566 RepID=UPI003718C8BE
MTTVPVRPACDPPRSSPMPYHRHRPSPDRVSVPVTDRARPCARIERARRLAPVCLPAGDRAPAEPMDTPCEPRCRLDLPPGVRPHSSRPVRERTDSGREATQEVPHVPLRATGPQGAHRFVGAPAPAAAPAAPVRAVGR